VACFEWRRDIEVLYCIEYNPSMYTILQLPEFDAWLCGLKDGLTRRRLAKRLRKAELGNLGDIEPVGDGVFEMREHFGPG
jgi:putative addiction module killer protein